MKKLKAKRLVAVLGASVMLASAAHAQSSMYMDRYGDYVTDNGNGSDASGGIGAWNADYNTMCGAAGPDSLKKTGNASEPRWPAPLCPTAG